MYLHQAMKQPDQDKFIATTVEEMDAQLKGKNFLLILRIKAPKGTTILPAVWQMKCKCQIQTWEVYKWKVHLNNDWAGNTKKPSPLTIHIDFWWLKYISRHNSNAIEYHKYISLRSSCFLKMIFH